MQRVRTTTWIANHLASLGCTPEQVEAHVARLMLLQRKKQTTKRVRKVQSKRQWGTTTDDSSDFYRGHRGGFGAFPLPQQQGTRK